MELMTKRQVIIIGAGPSGLALGYHLQQAGIDYLILEQNDAAGSSWNAMPEHLSLITQWHSNNLINEDLCLFERSKNHSAKEFSVYLRNFARHHALSISYRVKVRKVSREKQFFYIETDMAIYRSAVVVDCRGYFNFPYTPSFPVVGSPPLMLHFKDYHNTRDVEGRKNILIVGKRLSAGQLVRELSAVKKHKLFLATRSPIKYSSRPFIYNFFLRHLGILEKIIKKMKINIKAEIDVPMEFSAKSIVEREVQVRGEIERIENHDVFFSDGNKEEIDAIIFATGFHPPAEELENDFESKSTPGLYYLGRSGQRSFTSRFIRGIREDAPELCKLIAEKLSLSIKDQ
ncbi:FAD-dependent oxidoreductase [Bacteriovorax stolpii]|uniref:Monooxygenase n=1 Tax=Bacteriovorax stolpii TaxID=960 RepID=A0A2K9NUB9_BACTC|nr:FAD-dependent oxidoreductase [Bacteriovorax stolpii]AUN99126.1 hypothetical protein C0V70_13650 [Bacteriovorax stolpii]QDK40893.1 FAD-dependent oxidoreductase [Bacteriovorax stolpii]